MKVGHLFLKSDVKRNIYVIYIIVWDLIEKETDAAFSMTR